MPVACEMNYVILRKDAINKAKERVAAKGDLEAVRIAEELLSIEHADRYLVVIETMAGIGEDECEFWEKRLGLIGKIGYEAIDYYMPDPEVPICRWLEFSRLYEPKRLAVNRMRVMYDGYRFLGDSSREVNTGGTVEFPKVPCEDFPEVGEKIDMSRYDHINFGDFMKPPSWYTDYKSGLLKSN